MEIIVDNIDDLVNVAICEILKSGKIVSPRGMLVKEILGTKFVLTNPRNRISYNPVRHMKLSFAIGEFLWYISGSSDCETINYYNRRYHKYSDDGKELNGAYGKRIFGARNDKSQWQRIFELLQRDPDTRQAVISIFAPSDLNIVTKDVPCTNTIQFFIREDKLHCIVYMRSNDLVWGLPYDIFSFTMMQELMANLLGIDIGNYVHIVGSLHIYEHHFTLTHDMYNAKDYRKYTMPAMPSNIQTDLNILQDIEKKLRNQQEIDTLPCLEYVKGLLSVIYEYSKKRYNYPYTYNDFKIPDYLNICENNGK